MDEPIYKGMTKGVVADEAIPMPSPKWITSRRGILKVYGDRLECGDWIIPFDQIKESNLYKDAGLFYPGHVLRVVTNDRTYQFGLNPNRFWKNELPFKVERIQRSMTRTILVYGVRTLAIVALIYWLWTDLN